MRRTSTLNKPKVQAHFFSSVDWTFAGDAEIVGADLQGAKTPLVQ